MTTLDDFRDTITAGDTDTWLVFADWLEERGDERGKWVRRFAKDGVEMSVILWAEYGWEFNDRGMSNCVPATEYGIQHLSEEFNYSKGWNTPTDALLALADACVTSSR